MSDDSILSPYPAARLEAEAVGAESVLDMLRLLAGHYPYKIEPERVGLRAARLYIGHGGLDYLSALGAVHGFRRQAVGRVGAGAHFHESHGTVLAGDDVQLAPWAGPVAVQDLEAGFLQEKRGLLLVDFAFFIHGARSPRP